MVPSAPGHPRHAEVDAEPVAVNARLGAYTNFVNLLGWCALALPAGFAGRGLPFGVTFIAPRGHDAALARFGARWQAHVDLPLGATTRRLARRRAAERLTPKRGRRARTRCRSPSSARTCAACRSIRSSSRSAPTSARRRTPRRAIACSRCPTRRRPSPACCASPRAARRSRSRSGRCRARGLAPFLRRSRRRSESASIELLDGRRVHGFLCESHALAGASDITVHGGWRAYLASLASSAEAAHGA